jgi:flagellar biosynthetic protein FliQ
MTASLVAIAREGLLLVLLLAAPFVVAAVIAGIVSGLIAAFTQLQDPAIGTAVRVAAVGVAIVLFAPSIGHQLAAFMARLWPMITAAGTAGS